MLSGPNAGREIGQPVEVGGFTTVATGLTDLDNYPHLDPELRFLLCQSMALEDEVRPSLRDTFNRVRMGASKPYVVLSSVSLHIRLPSLYCPAKKTYYLLTLDCCSLVRLHIPAAKLKSLIAVSTISYKDTSLTFLYEQESRSVTHVVYPYLGKGVKQIAR